MVDTQHWTRANDGIRQAIQPVEYDIHLSTQRDCAAVLLDQVGSVCPIMACQRMIYRFRDQSLLLKPGARPPVEERHVCGGYRAAQALAQHLGEQVMVAVPLPRIVER